MTEREEALRLDESAICKLWQESADYYIFAEKLIRLARQSAPQQEVVYQCPRCCTSMQSAQGEK